MVRAHPHTQRAELEAIRERFAKYLDSPEFQEIFDRLHLPPSTPWLSRLGMRVRPDERETYRQVVEYCKNMKVGSQRRMREYRRLARRGVVIKVTPYMFNTQYRTDPEAIAGGLVYGAFEAPPNEANWRCMTGICVNAFGAMGESRPPRSARKIKRILSDQEHQFARRRRLPKIATLGVTTYVFDLMLIRKFDPDLSPEITCIAEPGARGLIAVLPPHTYQ